MKLKNLDEWKEYCTVTSESEPGKQYTLWINKDRFLKCECLGWRIRRPCKHVRQVVLSFRLGGLFVNFESRAFMTFLSEGGEQAVIKAIVRLMTEIDKDLNGQL